MHFMVVKKSRKRSGFFIYSYFKESVFTAVKRDAKFYARYVKGVPFVNRRCMKGPPFLSQLVYKRDKGLDLGAEPPPPPRIKLC